MLGCEFAQVPYPPGNLAADGVIRHEAGAIGESLADTGNQGIESFDTLRCLGIKGYVARKIYARQVVLIFNHYGGAVGLANEAIDLGVSNLPVNHYLRAILRVSRRKGVLDAFLQGKHNGTGSIDYLDTVARGHFIGRWGLAVGAEQHFDSVQVGKVRMGDGLQPNRLQTFNLVGIMHYIAEAIQAAGVGKFGLRLADCRHHTEAETRTAVNLYGRCHAFSSD